LLASQGSLRVAIRWVAALAMLVILANPALAIGAAAIAYRVEIVVPGDPTLAAQMQQITDKWKKLGFVGCGRQASED